MIILAQIAKQTSATIILLLCILAALAITLGVAAWIIRRLILGSREEGPLGEGFTLSDIRRLHRQGQMSDEEFETAKRLIIAQGLAMMDTGEDDGHGDNGDAVSDTDEQLEDEKNLPMDSDKMSDDDVEPRAG